VTVDVNVEPTGNSVNMFHLFWLLLWEDWYAESSLIYELSTDLSITSRFSNAI